MSDYTQERLRSLLYRTQKKKGPLMPPPVYPVTIDDNLVFLWRAIQHSNYTKIDFNLLGNDFQLNREEALECFRELRRAIEDAVYNNYMERSNDRRESAGPTNILGLAVRRRKETVEDAEYEDDEEHDGEKYDEEDADDEASHVASAKGDSLAAGLSRPGASKSGASNANASNAGPSRVSTPVTGSSKAGSSSVGTSKVGITETGYRNAGSLKQVSSASSQPAPGAGRPNTEPSNAVASQASTRPPSGGYPSTSRPSVQPSIVGPSIANISASRVAPSNVSLNAGHQRTGHTNATKAVNNPTMKSEAGQVPEGVKLAPIRAGQTLNLPLPRLTNPAGPPNAQPPNVGSLNTIPPSTIPASGAISGPQITRPPTVPAMNYFRPSAATFSAATSLTSVMTPQTPQLPNQIPSQIEDGPVILDITSLRCFFGVVDQGAGPTSLNDRLFSRPDFFFPIRTPTLPTPYGPDASGANEPQTQTPRPSLPSLSSLYSGLSMLAEPTSSPATMDKGKKRKRVSGSGGEMEEDVSAMVYGIDGIFQR